MSDRHLPSSHDALELSIDDIFGIFLDDEMYQVDLHNSTSTSAGIQDVQQQPHFTQQAEITHANSHSPLNITTPQDSVLLGEILYDPCVWCGSRPPGLHASYCVSRLRPHRHDGSCIDELARMQLPNTTQEMQRGLQSGLHDGFLHPHTSEEPLMFSQIHSTCDDDWGEVSPSDTLTDEQIALLVDALEPQTPATLHQTVTTRPTPQDESKRKQYELSDSDTRGHASKNLRAKKHIMSPKLASDPSNSNMYTARFLNFTDAQNYLNPPQQAPLQKLQLLNDDWRTVKGDDLHSYCCRLYEALATPGNNLPSVFPAYVQEYYASHQKVVLKSIQASLRADPLRLEARAMLMVQEIIKIHENGVPSVVYNRKAKKQGYKLEADLICSERVDTIIAIAQGDKYVADDIVKGTGLEDLARSPAQYAYRKLENSRVNAKKARDRDLKRQTERELAEHTAVKEEKEATQADDVGNETSHTQTPPNEEQSDMLSSAYSLQSAQSVEQSSPLLRKRGRKELVSGISTRVDFSDMTNSDYDDDDYMEEQGVAYHGNQGIIKGEVSAAQDIKEESTKKNDVKKNGIDDNIAVYGADVDCGSPAKRVKVVA